MTAPRSARRSDRRLGRLPHVTVTSVVPEAPLERNEAGGLYPAGEGWFGVNARDARWFESGGLGFYAPFESKDARFAELGINLAFTAALAADGLARRILARGALADRLKRLWRRRLRSRGHG